MCLLNKFMPFFSWRILCCGIDATLLWQFWLLNLKVWCMGTYWNRMTKNMPLWSSATSSRGKVEVARCHLLGVRTGEQAEIPILHLFTSNQHAQMQVNRKDVSTCVFFPFLLGSKPGTSRQAKLVKFYLVQSKSGTIRIEIWSNC